jgi:hypothetical protein
VSCIPLLFLICAHQFNSIQFNYLLTSFTFKSD